MDDKLRGAHEEKNRPTLIFPYQGRIYGGIATRFFRFAATHWQLGKRIAIGMTALVCGLYACLSFGWVDHAERWLWASQFVEPVGILILVWRATRDFRSRHALPIVVLNVGVTLIWTRLWFETADMLSNAKEVASNITHLGYFDSLQFLSVDFLLLTTTIAAIEDINWMLRNRKWRQGPESEIGIPESGKGNDGKR